MRIVTAVAAVIVLAYSGFIPVHAVPIRSAGFYDQGKPVVSEIWVDPVKGKDTNDGNERGKALRTLGRAWELVPSGKTLVSRGFRIMLVRGDYTQAMLPANGWMEKRYGTFECPVIIQAADGAGSVRIHGYFNIYDCRYLYMIGLDLVTDPGTDGGGNVVHLEKCDHILLDSVRLNGSDGKSNLVQETLKANQCRYVYVERCDISGAFWFALDFVAVQYGHVRGSRIHDSGDDCLLLKGGSAYFDIEGNEVYDSANIGFSAGQGTGFEFMVSPWIRYEAYNIKFTNNLVHDTRNAGMAVRGGYDILLAHNTLYRIGIDDEPGAPLLLVGPGMRSCDGNLVECGKQNKAGGWGPSSGDAGECIPNMNVFVYNNIFYNPKGTRTRWSHFQVYGPILPPLDTNIQSPVLSDSGLLICGNIVWNGPTDMPLGIENEGQGCDGSNPTCNVKRILSDNKINTLEPRMTDPGKGRFEPVKGGNVYAVRAFVIPKFPEKGLALPPDTPAGDHANLVLLDYGRNPRSESPVIGAFE